MSKGCNQDAPQRELNDYHFAWPHDAWQAYENETRDSLCRFWPEQKVRPACFFA